MKLQVSPARAEERRAALRLFFQRLSDDERESRVERALTLMARGEMPPACLLVCRDGPTVLGAMAALSLDGAAGMVWPPQVSAEAPARAVEDMLVHEATTWLRHRGAKFGQALLAAAEVASAAPLTRHGFTPTTALLYLQKELGSREDLGGSPPGVHCQSYTACDPALFHRALLQSYDETLDCPELNGLRTVEEILAGYRAVPDCRLDRWWLAWQNDRAAGVLITTSAQSAPTWELLYLGLVPAARGQGLGRELTRKALAEAQAAGATRMTLTVDMRNQPARRMYDSFGFTEFERREVYLAIFPRA